MVPEDTSAASPLPPDSPVLLVLLGASNLARGQYALARHMKSCLHPRRVDVWTASGPGRAYRVSGGLLNVAYTPIQSCAVFEAAREKQRAGYRILALVTDIGNDIMYGVSAEELIETVRQVLDRLRALEAVVYFTTLPIRMEQGVHPAWYYALRSILLPTSRVSYDEAQTAIRQVNQFLRETASQEANLIPEMDRFLGYDEIHYGWLQGPPAWSHVAQCLLEGLGVRMERAITLSAMLRSYGEDLRKVVGTDIAGFKKMPPGHY